MITIKCNKQEQEEICRSLAEAEYCVANNPIRATTCWKCDKDCIKKHIDWEITDESSN